MSIPWAHLPALVVAVRSDVIINYLSFFAGVGFLLLAVWLWPLAVFCLYTTKAEYQLMKWTIQHDPDNFPSVMETILQKRRE